MTRRTAALITISRNPHGVHHPFLSLSLYADNICLIIICIAYDLRKLSSSLDCYCYCEMYLYYYEIEIFANFFFPFVYY